MIRLVACDLDGTLLSLGGELPSGIFDLIPRMRERGIRFAAASGRQYGNVYRLFAPVAEQMDFLCENGALVVAGGKRQATYFPRETAEEIIRDIRDAGMELLLSTPEATCLCLGAPKAYTDDIFYRLGNTCALVADPLLYAHRYIKLSGFREEGVTALAPALQQKWNGRAHCDVAGQQWLDFTLTNKGTGLRALAEALGVALSDTAAFGDQFNDESMLDLAGRPYIMVHAPAPLLKKGYTPCRSVMETLEEILKQ